MRSLGGVQEVANETEAKKEKWTAEEERSGNVLEKLKENGQELLTKSPFGSPILEAMDNHLRSGTSILRLFTSIYLLSSIPFQYAPSFLTVCSLRLPLRSFLFGAFTVLCCKLFGRPWNSHQSLACIPGVERGLIFALMVNHSCRGYRSMARTYLAKVVLENQLPGEVASPPVSQMTLQPRLHPRH